jgi:predicted transcriptional regulator
MKTDTKSRWFQGSRGEASIAEVLERAKKTCQNCHPLTPITCVKTCDIWKLKNELRKLYKKTKSPDFVTNLLNSLKNKRRLKILEILANRQLSLDRIQQKLKELGYYHSLQTIANEYIKILIEVGLVEQQGKKYLSTSFGCKIRELTEKIHNIEDYLPPHSKCYEEKAIKALSESPKTHEELKSLIPAKSLPRVLERLQKAKLVTKDDGNSYVFHFRTKRNVEKEKLSTTEKRVYENIPEEGITTKALANKTNISLRRTYKYLRKLRGKKLAFRRRRPKTYALTTEGTQIARFLENMRTLLTVFKQAWIELKTEPTEITQQIQVPDTPERTKQKPIQIPIRNIHI